MSNEGKGLFWISDTGRHCYVSGVLLDESDWSRPAGTLLQGTGPFEVKEPDAGFFEECPPYDAASSTPGVGLYVIEGYVNQQQLQSGDYAASCHGTWRRPSTEELERLSRGEPAFLECPGLNLDNMVLDERVDEIIHRSGG